ncbi:hypothetical protein C8R44DRAFT_747988 [Mycena epipterygia]|nr:hypothetical protein C8R44DRAFT_747988 [Mycena epipterygia]
MSTSPIVPTSALLPTPSVHSPSPLNPLTDEPRTTSIKSELATLPSTSSTTDSASNLTQPSLPPSTLPLDLDPDEIRMAELQRELATLELHHNASASIIPAPESPPPSPTAPTSSPAHTEGRPDLFTPPTYRLPITSADQIPGYAPPRVRNLGLPPSPPPRKKPTRTTPEILFHSTTHSPAASTPAFDVSCFEITTRDSSSLPLHSDDGSPSTLPATPPHHPSSRHITDFKCRTAPPSLLHKNYTKLEQYATDIYFICLPYGTPPFI